MKRKNYLALQIFRSVSLQLFSVSDMNTQNGDQDHFYQRLLWPRTGPNQFHRSLWGGLILRDIDENGLRNIKTYQEYKDQDNEMWIHMERLLFRNERSEFYSV